MLRKVQEPNPSLLYIYVVVHMSQEDSYRRHSGFSPTGNSTDPYHTKRGPALMQANALNELHRTLLSYAAPYSGQRHLLSELRRSLVS